MSWTHQLSIVKIFPRTPYTIANCPVDWDKVNKNWLTLYAPLLSFLHLLSFDRRCVSTLIKTYIEAPPDHDLGVSIDLGPEGHQWK